jgi:hypothetical protein
MFKAVGPNPSNAKEKKSQVPGYMPITCAFRRLDAKSTKSA